MVSTNNFSGVAIILRVGGGTGSRRTCLVIQKVKERLYKLLTKFLYIHIIKGALAPVNNLLIPCTQQGRPIHDSQCLRLDMHSVRGVCSCAESASINFSTVKLNQTKTFETIKKKFRFFNSCILLRIYLPMTCRLRTSDIRQVIRFKHWFQNAMNYRWILVLSSTRCLMHTLWLRMWFDFTWRFVCELLSTFSQVSARYKKFFFSDVSQKIHLDDIQCHVRDRRSSLNSHRSWSSIDLISKMPQSSIKLFFV